MLKTRGLCKFFSKLFRELFGRPFLYMSKNLASAIFAEGIPLLYSAYSFKGAAPICVTTIILCINRLH